MKDKETEETQRSEAAAFLSVAEIAAQLGVKHQAVRRAISRGELPASKVCSRVRIARTDFEAWVQERRVAPDRRVTQHATVPVPRRGLKRLLDGQPDAP